MAAPPPYSAASALDRGFPAARAQLLEIAALLDRLDRAGQDANQDPRLRGLLAAAPLLNDGRGERVRRMLETWSDPTLEPSEHAVPGAACGVHA